LELSLLNGELKNKLASKNSELEQKELELDHLAAQKDRVIADWEKYYQAEAAENQERKEKIIPPRLREEKRVPNIGCSRMPANVLRKKKNYEVRK
jgi:hypothetical protein